jgi:hypothetical protein
MSPILYPVQRIEPEKPTALAYTGTIIIFFLQQADAIDVGMWMYEVGMYVLVN